MTKTYSPVFQLNNQIIKKLTEATAKEVLLKTVPISLKSKIDIAYLANIDAVHFSTKLEGNLLTYEQVTEALDNENTSKKEFKRDLKEVLNYSKTRAMLLEKSALRYDIDKKLTLDTHKCLMTNIVTGKLRGYYRGSQNVIKDSRSKSIIYLPPESSEVDRLMKSLFIWVKSSLLDDLSPYIVAAVFHYYFVTIHPFLDGNGRCARLLTSYILAKNGIMLTEYAALEKQHEHNRHAYYENLRKLQAQTFYDISPNIDLTSWLDYWLECLLSTYDEGIARCTRLTQNENELLLDDRLQKAVSLFKKHKKLKASDYQALMGLGRTQAVQDLNKLINNGFIIKVGGGRSQVYQVKI